ncbi:hypothetical protein PSAB6_350016 [Paraburkholderia sabiae]|nr:hypothetical protein PSAB6_350016 [Paraburkholderia sabiae]
MPTRFCRSAPWEESESGKIAGYARSNPAGFSTRPACFAHQGAKRYACCATGPRARPPSSPHRRIRP